MRVVMASSEVVPYAKTGGLADVLGALPRALHRLGIDVTVIMPKYASTTPERFPLRRTDWLLQVPVSSQTVTAAVLQSELDDEVPVYLVEADQYFGRSGLYGTPDGDYLDNAERFAFFGRAIPALLQRLGAPDVLHCHDWQTALAPVFLRTDLGRYPGLERVRTRAHGPQPRLPGTVLALRLASPEPRLALLHRRLARVLRQDQLPQGRSRLRRRRHHGEPDVRKRDPDGGASATGSTACWWRAGRRSPAFSTASTMRSGVRSTTRTSPRATPPTTSPGRRRARPTCRQRSVCRSIRRFQLIGIVSRLADQKGFDLITAVAPQLLRKRLQIVVLGSGDAHYQNLLLDLQRQFKKRLAVRIAFDNTLAHKIEAGSDMFLMPSRYEPCGLNQMYSLRYGTIPIVRATGGLQDSVVEFDARRGQGTGFKFAEYTGEALLACIERALRAYRTATSWTTLMRNAMHADFSWDRSAEAYADLYERLLVGASFPA